LKKVLLILGFLSFGLVAFCQVDKIEGTWEGNLDESQFLQVNIVQNGKAICGYSYDYVYDRPNDYCKQYYSGRHVASDDSWFFDGYSFMENHYNHVLMQFKVSLVTENGKQYLEGYLRTKGGGYYSMPSKIRLRKVSPTPQTYTQDMKDCLKEREQIEGLTKREPIIKPRPATGKTPRRKNIKPPVKPKTLPANTVKPKPVGPPSTKPKIAPKPILKPKPSAKTALPPKPVIKPKVVAPKPTTLVKDTIVTKAAIKPKIAIAENQLEKKLLGRENKEFKRIQLKDKKFTIEVYDNGTVDDDTISVFYNGKAIFSKRKINVVPLKYEVNLEEGKKLHNIVLFAENLGSIPPNTALVIITTASGKRYELFASSNLNENAEIIFEYSPD
jgi:hypothetical protein